MKTLISSLALLFGLTGVVFAQDIYKTVDEEGNITFSDTASDEAEKIAVEPVNVQSLPTAPPPPVKQAAPEKNNRYDTLEITSPAQDETLRDQPTITIYALLKPSLRGQDRVIFTDNGQPIGEPSRALSVSLPFLDRGTHTFQVKIVDSQGNTLITSSPVNVHVKRTIAPKPKPANNN